MLEISEYEIIEEIGRGGMSTVYKALQPSLGRYVALKVLPPHYVHDEEFVTRFRREAIAVAKMRHPNIIQVYEFHSEGDLSYLAMEYIDGGSLSEFLKKESPVSLETAAAIVSQIAEALHHAHQKGFIHRDIKPSNILLTADRRAVLTDFGITKALDSTRLTKTASFGPGTSEYMSPEQARGDNVDRRSDLYSLGVVWYEMLAGRCPFEAGNPLAVLHSQIYELPPHPSQFNTDIPAAVESVILKMLEKEAADRYQDAVELIHTITELAVTGGSDVVSGDRETLIKQSVSEVETKMKPDKAGKPHIESESETRVINIPASAGQSSPETRIKVPIAEEVTKQEGGKRETSVAGKAAISKPAVRNLPAGTQAGAGVEKQKPEGSRHGWRWIAAGILGAIVVAIAIAAFSIFVNNDDFHHQFSGVRTRTGGAKVSREINLQTGGGRSVYVVALRIKGGKGPIELRESIPKSAAKTVKDITFNIKPSVIINDDPVLLWRLMPKRGGNTIIYRMQAPREVTQADFDRLIADYAALPRLVELIHQEIAQVEEGKTLALKLIGRMSDETTVTTMPTVWESSNPDKATVDKAGRLKAIKAGNVTIRVRSGDIKISFIANIKPILVGIEISPPGLTMNTGSTRQLQAIGRLSDGSGGLPEGVTWFSTNPSVVVIDPSGVLYALMEGKSVITASSAGLTATSEITVQAPVTRSRSAGGSRTVSGGTSGGTSGGSMANPLQPTPDYVPKPLPITVVP